MIDANPLDETDVVLTLYRKSLSPLHIAEYYGCELTIILNILNLHGKPKEVDKQHREKNFYDHGNGDKHVDFRIEWYGEILQEGDFEKYQKYCYMKRYDPRFIITKFIVFRWKKEKDLIKEERRLWIIHRFQKYQEKEWGITENEIKRINKIRRTV